MIFRRIILWLIVAATVAGVGAQAPNNETSVQKLRLEKFVLPDFPEFVRLAGNQKGVVTAAIGRDDEGRVTDVLILSSSHALLTQSVVTAVKQWKFARPANVTPPGSEIVPIIRFLFSSKGVAFVTALTGSLANKDREVKENAPVIIPNFAELDSIPKPVNHPMPRITGSMVGDGDGGTATVKFFLDEIGRVRVPIVLECSTPELGRAAIAAVEQWTFEPPRAAGQPTIALEIETFTFAKSKR